MPSLRKSAGLIRARVMQEMNKRIEAAQAEYDKNAENLEASHRNDVAQLEQKLSSDKANLATVLVEKVLGIK